MGRLYSNKNEADPTSGEEPAGSGALHKRRTLVLLVHGTGDAALLSDDRRRWWQTESRFVARLKKSLEQILCEIAEEDEKAVARDFAENWDFVPFVWNGENKEGRRRQAAGKLASVLAWLHDFRASFAAELSPGDAARPISLIVPQDAALTGSAEKERATKLAALLSEHGVEIPELAEPYEDVRIVAHSHGGNVVYEALLLRAQRTREKAADREIVKRWVTVGTPFLRIRNADFRDLLSLLVWRAVQIVPAALAVLVVTVLAVLAAVWPMAGEPMLIAKAGERFANAFETLMLALRAATPEAIGGSSIGFDTNVRIGITVIAAGLTAFFGIRISERIAAIKRINRAQRDFRKLIGDESPEISEFVSDVDKAVIGDANHLVFHKRFGGRWRNVYSVQDEAIAALSRFDEDKLTATKDLLKARVRRFSERRLAGFLVLPLLLWAYLQLPDADGLAKFDHADVWRVAAICIGALAAAYGVWRKFPDAAAWFVGFLSDSLWYVLSRRGLGDDGSSGRIESAAASLNRFRQGRRQPQGSFARFNDLRDRSLPSEAEGDLHREAFQSRYDDQWRENDLVAGADLVESNDSFIRFLINRLGRRPLIHTSYFRSRVVTDIIAYALVREMDARQEDDRPRAPLEKLRQHEDQGTQTYSNDPDRNRGRFRDKPGDDVSASDGIERFEA